MLTLMGVLLLCCFFLLYWVAIMERCFYCRGKGMTILPGERVIRVCPFCNGKRWIKRKYYDKK